jgi:hypothetical protein
LEEIKAEKVEDYTALSSYVKYKDFPERLIQ